MHTQRPPEAYATASATAATVPDQYHSLLQYIWADSILVYGSTKFSVSLCLEAHKRKTQERLIHSGYMLGSTKKFRRNSERTVSSSWARMRYLSRWLWTIGSRLSAAVFIKLTSTANNISCRGQGRRTCDQQVAGLVLGWLTVYGQVDHLSM